MVTALHSKGRAMKVPHQRLRRSLLRGTCANLAACCGVSYSLSLWERAGASRCGSRSACALLDSAKKVGLGPACGLQDRDPRSRFQSLGTRFPHPHPNPLPPAGEGKSNRRSQFSVCALRGAPLAARRSRWQAPPEAPAAPPPQGAPLAARRSRFRCGLGFGITARTNLGHSSC